MGKRDDLEVSAEVTARIVTMMTMMTKTATLSNIATLTSQRQEVEEAMELARLVEFAADVNQLANERIDLELRRLVDDLHVDLLRGDDEGE